jgi:hypothetical protein
MSAASILSVLFLYPITLVGDGCLLIAIALAATVGGRPLLWGGSFALFHALYGILGILVASEIATYSDWLGHLFVVFGSIVLLRHFVHHRLHHQTGGDCSCDNHKPIPLSARAIVSTASAFSLHSLASGAIVRNMVGDISTTSLAALVALLSIIIGTLIFVILIVGDKERLPILHLLDKLPGVVAAVLTAVCCLSIHHIARDIWAFSPVGDGIFALAAVALSIHFGRKAHSRGSHVPGPTVTSIGRRTQS